MANTCIGYRLANVAITTTIGATPTQEKIAHIRLITVASSVRGLPRALDELSTDTDVPASHRLGPGPGDLLLLRV